MKLLALRMANFRSFADADLDLNVDGLIAVVGPNGAGKSTIFSAVEWALFGAKRGASALPTRRQDCPEGDHCWVELEFEVGGRTYLARRVNGREASFTDLESGQVLATTLTDTSRQAAATLGLTHEMFCGTFYARQREVQALSESTKVSERRGQLERLLGIEHLRRAAELAARDAKEQKVYYETLAAEAPDVDGLKAEVTQIEREAQDAEPMVKAARDEVERIKTELTAARARLDALAAQAEEHGKRALAAQEVATELSRELAIRDNLTQQLETARASATELEQLLPVANRVEELAAQERELDLRRENHERAMGLRERQRQALTAAATLAEQIAPLVEGSDDPQQLARELQRAQDEVGLLGSQLRDVGAARQQADAKVAQLHAALSRLEQANELAAQLREIGDVDVDEPRERWAALRDQRADVAAALAHDAKHHDALVAGGETAVCPTCKRPLEDSYESLVVAFVRDIDAHNAKLEELDRDIATAVIDGNTRKSQVDRAQALQAQLNALGELEDAGTLKAALASAEETAAKAATHEAELEGRYGQLQQSLPGLRERVGRATATAVKRNELEAARTQAERDAALFNEQLGQVGSNGYDAEAHSQLRATLIEGQDAARRCAALRASADSVELLEGRAKTQQDIIDTLLARHAERSAFAAEITVAATEQQQVRERRDSLDRALDEAQSKLAAVVRQATLDSQAVAAAHERLDEARKARRRITRERREYQWRHAVADALSAYREDASRRARPMLEEEASLLLSQVTQTRYGTVRLNDSYLLQVADGRELHSIKRFSGGEQDLASLCLRLALSRTLARQRGVETGFVILDEVFGSQDPVRRQLLLEQLRQMAEQEFRQIFVISHTDDIAEHCTLHIDVRRADGQPSVAEGPTT